MSTVVFKRVYSNFHTLFLKLTDEVVKHEFNERASVICSFSWINAFDADYLSDDVSIKSNNRAFTKTIEISFGTVSAKIAPRLKCYKNASRLNRYNFPTDNAIDFLFSTLHTTPFHFDFLFSTLHTTPFHYEVLKIGRR